MDVRFLLLLEVFDFFLGFFLDALSLLERGLIRASSLSFAVTLTPTPISQRTRFLLRFVSRLISDFKVRSLAAFSELASNSPLDCKDFSASSASVIC